MGVIGPLMVVRFLQFRENSGRKKDKICIANLELWFILRMLNDQNPQKIPTRNPNHEI